ncbi:Leukotoxin [Nymphon striatum]|nr:Leukotoxin [Nymphon striatum]
MQEQHNQLYRQPSRNGLDRRRFLQGLLAAGGVATMGGVSLLRDEAQATPLGPNDRILVLVHLDGGNDGLNTIVPFNDSAYAAARGNIAISPSAAHSVGNDLWLHPNMGDIKGLYDQGKVAMVHGLGESSDDLSHFTSIARWMAGTDANAPWYSGWMGRYLDGGGLPDLGGVVVDNRGIPLHMARQNGEATMLPSTGNLFGADLYEDGSISHSGHMYNALESLGSQNIGKGTWGQALAGATAGAIAAAQEVTPIYSPEIPEQTDDLVRDMTLCGRLINLDVGARVLGVRLGGFDTHDAQRPDHDNLLGSVNDGIAALLSTVSANLRDRVVIMTFSEFGRRVARNGIVGNRPRNRVERIHHRRRSRGRPLRPIPIVQRSRQPRQSEASRGLPLAVLGGNYENLHLFATDRCEGYVPTIIGTEGSDTITGTNGQDVILGLGGNDVVYGRGGNDIICGGDGHDTIFGGSGNDTIRGESGNDDVRGESGNDNLGGDVGNDKISGGRGADTISGGSGADQLTGQRRDDTFVSDVLDIITRGQ